MIIFIFIHQKWTKINLIKQIYKKIKIKYILKKKQRTIYEKDSILKRERKNEKKCGLYNNMDITYVFIFLTNFEVK